MERYQRKNCPRPPGLVPPWLSECSNQHSPNIQRVPGDPLHKTGKSEQGTDPGRIERYPKAYRKRPGPASVWTRMGLEAIYDRQSGLAAVGDDVPDWGASPDQQAEYVVARTGRAGETGADPLPALPPNRGLARGTGRLQVFHAAPVLRPAALPSMPLSLLALQRERADRAKRLIHSKAARWASSGVFGFRRR